MNDRELLEMAAKAAGYHYKPKNACIVVDGIPGVWNPLNDDGDAFRLAVKLRMEIDHNHPADQSSWVSAAISGCEGCWSPVSCVEDEFDEVNRGSATRRAIVRAAAEIGRNMK